MLWLLSYQLTKLNFMDTEEVVVAPEVTEEEAPMSEESVADAEEAPADEAAAE